MSQIMKVYFFCTFLGYNLCFFSRFFLLFFGDEPVATLKGVESRLHTSDQSDAIEAASSLLRWGYSQDTTPPMVKNKWRLKLKYKPGGHCTRD